MCTFCTHGRREHLLEGCGAQQGVCHKTPDINELSVPAGKLHTSLPTPDTAAIGVAQKEDEQQSID